MIDGFYQEEINFHSNKNENFFSNLKYQILIEISSDKNKFKRSKLIYFYSEYLIDNQTSFDILIKPIYFNLIINQYFTIDKEIQIKTKTKSIFHHCYKREIELKFKFQLINEFNKNSWSFPYLIKKNHLIYLNLFLNENQNQIISIKTFVQKNRICFIELNDFNQFFSPYSIKNYSKIPIEIQLISKDFNENYFKYEINPNKEISFILDQYLNQPKLFCSIPFFGTKSFYDFNQIQQNENLVFFKFISISFQIHLNENLTKYFLLDYNNEKKIFFLNEKQLNKKSQWWYLTSNGYLIHYLSSLNINWNQQNLTNDEIQQTFVLDIQENINENNLVFNQIYQLKIEKFNFNRQLTQQWLFIDKKFLKLKSKSSFIQILSSSQNQNYEIILKSFS